MARRKEPGLQDPPGCTHITEPQWLFSRKAAFPGSGGGQADHSTKEVNYQDQTRSTVMLV